MTIIEYENNKNRNQEELLMISYIKQFFRTAILITGFSVTLQINADSTAPDINHDRNGEVIFFTSLARTISFCAANTCKNTIATINIPRFGPFYIINYKKVDSSVDEVTWLFESNLTPEELVAHCDRVHCKVVTEQSKSSYTAYYLDALGSDPKPAPKPGENDEPNI